MIARFSIELQEPVITNVNTTMSQYEAKQIHVAGAKRGKVHVTKS